MRYRICDHVSCSGEIGENDIYRKFRYQFDSLLAADEIPCSDEEFETLYVSDSNFERDMYSYLSSIRNSTKFCVGYTGIGKTTSVRHCMKLGISNVTTLKVKSRKNPGKYIIIFPTFLDNARSDSPQSLDITGRISAVFIVNVCLTTKITETFLQFTLSSPAGTHPGTFLSWPALCPPCW